MAEKEEKVEELIEFTTQSSLPRFQVRFFSLPLDLCEICVAFVRRCSYWTLSQVSRFFRDLISGSRLYQIRSSLGVTDSTVYVALRDTGGSMYYTAQWHIFNGKEFVLLSHLSHMHTGSVVLTIGEELYVMGGYIDHVNILELLVINCRTQQETFLPPMRRGRNRAAAGYIGGKIYVIGGFKEKSADWIEAFDLEKKEWSTVPGPCPYAHMRYKFENFVVMGDKFFLWDDGFCYSYEPTREPRGHWSVRYDCPLRLTSPGKVCVVENRIYAIDTNLTLGYPTIAVYDPNENSLKAVKGVSGPRMYLLRFLNSYDTKMVNFGGKLMFLGHADYQELYCICCVKIVLERGEDGEIWGEVESVQSLPDLRQSEIFHCCTPSF